MHGVLTWLLKRARRLNPGFTLGDDTSTGEVVRYILRAPIEGNIVLQYPNGRISAERNGVELALEVGEKGVIAHAIASIKVPNDNVEAFRSSTGPGVHGSDFSLNVGGDRKLYELLLAALQELELDLAFAFPGNALRRIRWTDVEHRFAPETPEEEVPF